VQPARLGHGGLSRSGLGWELRVLQCKTLTCNAFAPLGAESRTHPYLRAGLRNPHSLELRMARFRLSSHNLGVELGGHQGVVWFARGCK
jgi:hypothetical protein